VNELARLAHDATDTDVQLSHSTRNGQEMRTRHRQANTNMDWSRDKKSRGLKTEGKRDAGRAAEEQSNRRDPQGQA